MTQTYSVKFAARGWLSAAGLLMTWLCTGATAAASEPLLYPGTANPPYYTEDGQGVGDRLTKEAFRRMDLEVEHVLVQPARAADLVNRGMLDFGLAGPQAAPFVPNTVQVPGGVGRVLIVAFSKAVTELPDGWASLAGYRVAYVRGWLAIEARLPPGANVHAVSRPQQMLEMLDQGRVDIVVADRLLTQLQLNDMGITGVRVVEPPLIEHESQFFLHKKHAALVPRLAAALRAMKADGSYQRIWDETLREYGIQSSDPYRASSAAPGASRQRRLDRPSWTAAASKESRVTGKLRP